MPKYAWVSNHPLFRSLTAKEVAEFTQYARDNDPPAGTALSILHPVCVAEWHRRGKVSDEELPEHVR